MVVIVQLAREMRSRARSHHSANRFLPIDDQQHLPAPSRGLVGGGQAGNAGADDDEIATGVGGRRRPLLKADASYQKLLVVIGVRF